ncbi:MAG: glycosyltransferase [Acidimicrobiales bacterium]|nr:glycosyltransferase [Acidimicrobiales bacterium]
MSLRLPPQRPRLLHTFTDLAPAAGQAMTLHYLAHRDERSFDVRIVFVGPPTELFDGLARTGVRLHRLSHPPTDRRALLGELVRLIRTSDADLLHVHGPLDRRIAVAAAAMTRTPVLCHLHADAGLTRAGSAVGARLERRVVAEYLLDEADAARRLAARVPQRVSHMPADAAPAQIAHCFERAYRRILLMDEAPAIRLDPPASADGAPSVLTATKG